MVKKLKPGTDLPIEVELTAHDVAVADFKDTVKAIQEDYLIEDGAVLEIGTAVDNLLQKLNEANEAVDEEFEEPPLQKAAIEAAMQNNEIEADDLMDLIDGEDMARKLASEYNYFIVRIDSMADRDKLSEFVKTEIYPFYNDQKANLFE